MAKISRYGRWGTQERLEQDQSLSNQRPLRRGLYAKSSSQGPLVIVIEGQCSALTAADEGPSGLPKSKQQEALVETKFFYTRERRSPAITQNASGPAKR
jgi:hypothetical protein